MILIPCDARIPRGFLYANVLFVFLENIKRVSRSNHTFLIFCVMYRG